MPRRRRRASSQKWSMGRVLFAGVCLMLIGLFIFGGPLEFLYNQYAPEAWRHKPEGVQPDAELVDLSIKVGHKLDLGDPAATPIRVYDEDMNFIESASTSSGVATFKAPYWEGETIFLQARAAAPAASGFVTYTTPAVEMTVPEGDANGDAELPLLWLWEVSTSVIKYNITDQDTNTVYTEATQYINTTDTSLIVTFTITADCAFGTPEAFTDYDTGKHYLAGVWIVMTCTTAQSIINYASHFYSSSLHYYVFNLPMIVYDSDMGYLTGRQFTIDTGTAGFTASTDANFDVYDICWADSMGAVNENSFMNGDSDLNPSALANAIA